MGKELKKKASLILGPRAAILAVGKDEETGRPKTAIGAMAQFTNRQSEALKEAEELRATVKVLQSKADEADAAQEVIKNLESKADKADGLATKLKEFDGSLPVRKIDPKLIVRSKWANRHAHSFVDPEFAQLKKEMLDAGGNVQPIKVRRLKDGSGKYEIVFGQRRHQAALELGLDVLAMVDDLDDKSLFIEMDRENRQRKDLRPFEIGAMYNKALEAGLFSSARQLADEIGFDQSQLTKALNLAKLPADVTNAFISPLDLQYRWSTDLVAAIQKDPDFVLARAKEIQALVPRPSSNEVFARLIAGRGTVPHWSADPIQLEGKGRQKGTLLFDAGKGTAQIKLANIAPAKFEKLQILIKEFLSK
jgi:ParB family chromosome partitioning protein